MPANHLTGRAVEGGFRGMGKLISLGLGTEVVYSFVIIICCLMIYFSTKKLYELSSHKGIKYFRNSFLIFAFAYFFKSFVKFSSIIFNQKVILGISPYLLSFMSSFIFIFLNSIAIFCLLYSIIWKKIDYKLMPSLFYIIAFIISIIMLLSKNPLTYLIVNLFLLILSIGIIYAAKNTNKNKPNKMYSTYFLLSIFLILNIIDTFIPNFLQSFQLIIYLSSLGIFLVILYKVLTKIGR